MSENNVSSSNNFFPDDDNNSQDSDCHLTFEQNDYDMEINVLQDIWQPDNKNKQKDVPKIPKVVLLLVAWVCKSLGIPKFKDCTVLIDSGASGSIVSQEIARKLRITKTSVYIDDNFCTGQHQALEQLVHDLKSEGLSVKVLWDLKDYLSCTIAISDDKQSAWIGQPHMVKKLEERFGYMVNKNVQYLLLGTPNFRIARPKNNDKEAQDIAEYQSAIGMLLFLLKHSQSCLANLLRELSKVLDCAAWKELCRLVKFVIDTKQS